MLSAIIHVYPNTRQQRANGEANKRPSSGIPVNCLFILLKGHLLLLGYWELVCVCTKDIRQNQVGIQAGTGMKPRAGNTVIDLG